jgi:preprotein translocase subunit SecG
MEMQVIETLVLVMHVLAAIAIIGLVLIQHGKGADMGSGFGGGASSTVFGSGGAGNFLSKSTTWLAIAFFLTSFTLAFFAKEKSVAARNLGLPEVVQQAPAQAELPVLESARDSEVPVMEPDDSDLPQD